MEYTKRTKKLTPQDFPGLEVYVYPDRHKDSEFEDDCFIHIVRNHQRVVFFNGQGEKAYTENDTPRFIKMVEDRLRRK